MESHSFELPKVQIEEEEFYITNIDNEFKDQFISYYIDLKLQSKF